MASSASRRCTLQLPIQCDTDEEGRSSAGLKFEGTGGVKTYKEGDTKSEMKSVPPPSLLRMQHLAMHALVTDVASVFAAS